MYDRSLSLSEVSLLYNNASPLAVAGPNLIAFWDFNDIQNNIGDISPNAIRSPIPTPITVQQTTKFTTRLRRDDGLWGVIDSVTIKVNGPCKLCKKVIFTEINYHPNKFLPENFKHKSHFIELKNIGQETVSLTGSYLSINGFYNHTFPVTSIPPGGFYVVGFFDEDYKQEYSRYPNHIFRTRLADDDELTLFDPLDNVVHTLAYEPGIPYSKLADGFGYSLVVNPKDYQTVASVATKPTKQWKYWRYSTNLRGKTFFTKNSVRRTKIDF